MLIVGFIAVLAPIQLAATYHGKAMALPEFFTLFFIAAFLTGAFGVAIVHVWNWVKSRRSRSKFEIVGIDYSNEMRAIDEAIRYLDPDRAKKR